MLSRSNEYKQKIQNNRTFLAKSIITFADETEITLYSYDRIRSVKINDGVSEAGMFTVGGAIINKLSLCLDNIDNGISQYDFTGAKIVQYIGLQLSESVEYLKKGVYTVDSANTTGGVINITALDNMSMFDKLYKPGSYPASLLTILNSVCTQCGIVLLTQSFTNSDLIISTAPEGNVTCREMVAYIAQIAGCFARVNVDGYLEIKWYNTDLFDSAGHEVNGGKFDTTNYSTYQTGDMVDGGNFINYASGDNADSGSFISLNNIAHIFKMQSQDIATDDIIITGVQVIASCENPTTYFNGQEGYVVEISENPLIQSDGAASSVATSLYNKIGGFTFRPYTISAQSDPAIEAGDVTYITDNKGNTYKSFISNVSYTTNGFETYSADAETKLDNNAVGFNATSKILQKVKSETDRKLSAYDIMVQQMTSLICNSFGGHTSEEDVEGGGKIFYLHDKPTRDESTIIWKMTPEGFAVSKNGGETYGSGWDANGNAVLNVLSAIGINADWIQTGEISGIYLDFQSGKLGNMTVGPDGLIYNDPNTDFNTFYIDTGNNIIKFDAFSLSIVSNVDTIEGLPNRMNELVLDYNYGTTLTTRSNYSNGDYHNFATYRVSYADEVPYIDISTIENNEYTDNVTINGYSLYSRLHQVDKNANDIVAIKLKLGML